MAYYNEIDPFCCEVLKARMADGRLPQGQVDGRDVREVRPDEIPAGQVHLFAGIGGFAAAARLAGLPDDFDIWTGGFPCQDISTAGKAAGLHGSRSGLFFEITRLLHGVKRRPAWVLLENVPALRTRGYDRVCAEMAGAGYAVWGLLVGAWAVGAPHKRNRAWIVCHLDDTAIARWAGNPGRKQARSLRDGTRGAKLARPRGGGLVNAKGGRAWAVPTRSRDEGLRAPDVDGPSERLADAEGRNTAGCVPSGGESALTFAGNRSSVANSNGAGPQEHPSKPGDSCKECPPAVRGCWPARPGEPQHEWEAARLLELPLGGLIDGIPAKLVRLANRSALKAYGNSIVPQVAAEIMRAMTGGPVLAASEKERGPS